MAPKGKVAALIYALKVNGEINLDKLAAFDKSLSINLGEIDGSREIKKQFFWTKAIEKHYLKNKNGKYGLCRFMKDGSYGYIMTALSSEDNFTGIYPVFDSFKTDVPYLTNALNKLAGRDNRSASEIFTSLAGIVVLFTLTVGLGLLGHGTRNHAFGLFLCVLIPVALGATLFFVVSSLKIAMIAATVSLVLMFAGRFGVVMWAS